MKRLIFAIILLCGILITACNNQLKNKQPDQLEKIKIGFIGPLTGDVARWGMPPKEGVELALGQLDKNIFEVFYEDSNCDVSTASIVAQKLIEVNHVDAIIGAVCSSATLAIAPITEQNRVILISPASTSPKITSAGDYVFRVVPSDSLRGEVFAKFLKEDLGLSKVSLLYINNDGGLGNKDSFKKTFEKLGGFIEITESYEQDLTNVKNQLLKIKQTNPEGLVVVSYPQDSVIVLKQIQELGLNIPLYFQTEALDDPLVINSAGSAAEGVTYVLTSKAGNNEAQKFQKLFEEKFNKQPALYAAEGYDVFNLLIDAYTECNRDNLCVKNKLYTTHNYQGASGIITFDYNGDVIKPMAIKQIVNGQKELIVIK